METGDAGPDPKAVAAMRKAAKSIVEEAFNDGMSKRIDAEFTDRRSDAVTANKQRRMTGWVTGGVAVGGVTCVFAVTAMSLPAVPSVTPVAGDSSGIALYYVWTILAAHVAVNLAAIYFMYQLLRAAERMLLPLHLEDIRARDLTGVYSPVESLLGLVFGARRPADPEPEP